MKTKNQLEYVLNLGPCCSDLPIALTSYQEFLNSNASKMAETLVTILSAEPDDSGLVGITIPDNNGIERVNVYTVSELASAIEDDRLLPIASDGNGAQTMVSVTDILDYAASHINRMRSEALIIGKVSEKIAAGDVSRLDPADITLSLQSMNIDLSSIGSSPVVEAATAGAIPSRILEVLKYSRDIAFSNKPTTSEMSFDASSGGENVFIAALQSIFNDVQEMASSVYDFFSTGVSMVDQIVSTILGALLVFLGSNLKALTTDWEVRENGDPIIDNPAINFTIPASEIESYMMYDDCYIVKTANDDVYLKRAPAQSAPALSKLEIGECRTFPISGAYVSVFRFDSGYQFMIFLCGRNIDLGYGRRVQNINTDTLLPDSLSRAGSVVRATWDSFIADCSNSKAATFINDWIWYTDLQRTLINDPSQTAGYAYGYDILSAIILANSRIGAPQTECSANDFADWASNVSDSMSFTEKSMIATSIEALMTLSNLVNSPTRHLIKFGTKVHNSVDDIDYKMHFSGSAMIGDYSDCYVTVGSIITDNIQDVLRATCRQLTEEGVVWIPYGSVLPTTTGVVHLQGFSERVSEAKRAILAIAGIVAAIAGARLYGKVSAKIQARATIKAMNRQRNYRDALSAFETNPSTENAVNLKKAARKLSRSKKYLSTVGMASTSPSFTISTSDLDSVNDGVLTIQRYIKG